MMHLRWFYPFFLGLGVGLIAMILHECGHIAAAFGLGVRVKRVGIEWNKGIFTVRDQGTVRQNLVIAMAGPFVNMLLIGSEPWYPVLALANLCYALANMLPIEGSDGFRIAACWRRIREEKLAN
ncbi:MAG: hypothetical protein WBX19_04680 [Terracidiphilus sp.]